MPPPPAGTMTPISRCPRGLLAVVAMCFVGGCARDTAHLRLTSHQRPEAPQVFTITFDRCASATDPSGDVHVTAYATSGLGTEVIRQYMHLQMFWRPQPGRTPTNPTATDATLRYVLQTRDGVLVYLGSAFVYPRRRPDGVFEARVESGRMHLDRTFGEAPDVLGSSELLGRVEPENDPELALDIRREMDRLIAGHGSPLGR